MPLTSNVVELCTDSAAAKSFVSRRGLGRMRHLELRHLWLQREVGLGLVMVTKVAGEANLADAMTKFLNRKHLADHLNCLGVQLLWQAPS